MSARDGDNVSSRSERTPWYSGPHLLGYLETIDVEDDRAGKPFRMPVQWVNRPNADFRGFAGTIASGSAKPGDEIAILPSGQTTKIKRIIGAGGDLAAAQGRDSVTITLADEIDVSRGDMFAALRDRPQVADQFAAHLVWMSAENLFPGRSYLMKINHSTLPATVTEIKHRIDVTTLSKLAAKTLALNEVGVCNLSVTRPVVFDAYADNRDTGAFILIDRYSNETVAAGMIDFALRRATNIHHHEPHGKQSGALGAHASPPRGLVVHRSARLGKIDYREPCRSRAARARGTHRHLGRRQCAARLEQGPGLYRV